MSSNGIATDVNNDKEIEFPNAANFLLWKLSMKRKEAYEAMNSDVDEVVSQCCKAKRHLLAVEDSNRNLKKEVLCLRAKYEALLEKNKKDTGIIMRLKDSESVLKQAKKCQEDTNESLLLVKIKNKEKSVERELLQNNLAKLVFKSQTTTNSLNKINLKHKRLHEVIVTENKKGKENEKQLVRETKELRLNLSKDDDILEKWQKYNTERDAAIRNLQDDLKEGSMMKLLEVQEENQSLPKLREEELLATDVPEIEQPVKDKNMINKAVAEKEKSDDIGRKQAAVRRQWLRKKILYEVAEKQKEHWVDFYVALNKRIKELSIEMVNVRQWRIDKEAQKRELSEKAEELELTVLQKRRNKPVPDRTLMDELDVWIKVQREANEVLRNVASKCLSIKVEDSATYSELIKTVRDMYLGSLRNKLSLDTKNDRLISEEKNAETENGT